MVHISRPGQLLDILFDWEVWRRVGFITFALNFYSGGLNPFGYHVFNIIIHSLTAFVLFLVVLKTLTLPALSDKWKAQAPQIALSGSLIWLVHPVQIMAVSYTVQRFASLAALFFLLSMLFYIHGRMSLSWKRFLMYGLSFLSSLAALGSKQNAAILPFVILLYEFFFFMNLSFKENRRKLLFGVIAIAVLGVVFVMAFTGPGFITNAISDTTISKGWTPYERLITQLRVVVLYISLLIYPHPSRLNVDYDFPLSHGLFSPPSTILSLILLTGLLAFSIYRAGKNPLFSFAILWFFANLTIESMVYGLDLVYEHRLYLPSMGPAILFAGFIHGFKHSKLKKAGIASGILVILVFSYWTYERNHVWQDPVTLWEDNVKKSPNRARVHGNLGKAYLDKKQYEKARLEFEKVIKLDSRLLGAYDNLATIYIDHFRQYDRARAYLNEAIRRNPDYPSPYLNLGVINLHLKQLPEAIINFKKVLELDPENHLGHYNLAAACFNLRNYEEAVSIIKKGINIWPGSSKLYGLLGVTWYHKGEKAKAEAALTRALDLDPSNGMAEYYMKKLR
jgi:Tfp pilus assembly protein PilF